MNCPFCNRDMIPNVQTILSKYRWFRRYKPHVTIYLSCPLCRRILAHTLAELDRGENDHTYTGNSKLVVRYD